MYYRLYDNYINKYSEIGYNKNAKELATGYANYIREQDREEGDLLLSMDSSEVLDYIQEEEHFTIEESSIPFIDYLNIK